jgi:GntR family transcriptional repressor for pyruvate dehydrogenase complex
MRTAALRPAAPTPRSLTSLTDVVLRPVREGNAFESTVEHLATAIRLGVFTEGEWLPPERELADRLRIGRATLREAIGALRQAGLVRTHRGRGGGTVVLYTGRPEQARDLATTTRGDDVTPPSGAGNPAGRLSRADVAEALAFRGVVEPGAAQLAARAGLSGDQRAWLRETLRATLGVQEVGARRIATSRLHLAIAALSGSAPLVEAVTQARSVIVDLYAQVPASAQETALSDAQHAVIVQAVLDGDHLRARAAMEEHCEATSVLLRSVHG